jgi:DNA-binding NarL/FixJ family response regulator
VTQKAAELSTSARPPRHPLAILFLGNAQRAEFKEARRCLDDWGMILECANGDAAAALLAEGRIVPDLIVVAQTAPGQFAHEAIDRLRRLAPLARIVGLMGAWCEGEMRTGSPWPGSVRAYWHQWPAQCDRELDRLSRGTCGAWTLPITATEEERLLATAAESWPHRPGSIVLRSPSHEMADWLSAACQARGLSTIRLENPTGTKIDHVEAVLFDVADFHSTECEALQHWASAFRPAPVIALLSFPRIDDHCRAVASGAAIVLSKPLASADFDWALDQVKSRSLVA